MSDREKDKPAKKPLGPNLKPAAAQSAPGKPAPAKNRAPAAEKTPESGEVGGRGGLDPTRYGDWEINGRCVDF